MSRVVEPLSKSDIREFSGNSFYVLNTSDLGGREKRAEVLMTFNVNGQPKTIEIPSTWIPLDLMTRVPLDDIKNNNDFWHHINRRSLTVITTEAAEEFLDSTDAQEEFDRVYEISDEEREKARGRHSQGQIDLDDRILQQNRGQLAKGNLKRETACAKVIAIMKKQSITEGNRLAALRNIERELKIDDINYIIKEARGEGQDRVKEWATGIKNKM